MNQSVLVNGATDSNVAAVIGRLLAHGEAVMRLDKLTSRIGATNPHCGTARIRRCDAGS
jgi:hypothetical protein